MYEPNTVKAFRLMIPEVERGWIAKPFSIAVTSELNSLYGYMFEHFIKFCILIFASVVFILFPNLSSP